MRFPAASTNLESFLIRIASCFTGLKVLPHGKFKLVDENLLEGIQVILLVEDEHRLLVIDGVNRTETQRTVILNRLKDMCLLLIIGSP